MTSVGKAVLTVGLALGQLRKDSQEAARNLKEDLPDVEVKVKVDGSAVEGAGRGFGKLKGEAQGAKEAVDGLNESGSVTQSVLQGIGVGIGSMGLSLLVESLTAAVAALKNFAGEGLALANQLNAAEGALESLGVKGKEASAALADLSKEFGYQVSTIDLTKSAYDVYSARTESLTKGLTDAEVATNILRAATIGAVGGFSETNTVADALTSTLNSYGLSADLATDLVDKLSATQNAGKITIGQYAQQIGNLAPIAAQAGISIDELNGFIATATVKGVPVSSTFAGIRQAISATLKPSLEATELAKSLRIEFGPLALKTKGLAGIIGELNKQGKDTPEVLTQLFGSVEAVAAIAPSVGEGFKTLNDNIALSANSAGAGQKAYEAVAGTLENRLKSATNIAQNALLQFGQSIQPIQASLSELFANTLQEASEQTKAFDIIKDAADRFTQTLESNPEIVKQLGTALAEIADLLAQGIANTLNLITDQLASPALPAFLNGFMKGLEAVGSVLNFIVETIKVVNQVVTPVAVVVTAVLTKALEGLGFLVNGLTAFIQKIEEAAVKMRDWPVIKQLVYAAEVAGRLVNKLAQIPGVADKGLSGAIDKLNPTPKATPRINDVAKPATPVEKAVQVPTGLYQKELAALQDFYSRQKQIIATQASDGVITEEEARKRNFAQEQSYYAKRIAFNERALAQLRAVNSSKLNARDAKTLSDEIRKTENALAQDRLAIARSSSTERSRLRQAETAAERKATQERTQAAKAALKAVEDSNKAAEAAIATSQTERITRVRQAQLAGAIGEKEAAQQIARIQQQSTSDTIAQKQRELQSIQQLRASGQLSAEEAAKREAEIQGEIASANLQRIQGEIELRRQASEQAIALRQQELQVTLEAAQAELDAQSQGLQSEQQLLSAGESLLESRNNLEQEILANKLRNAQAEGRIYDVERLQEQIKKSQRDFEDDIYRLKQQQLKVSQQLREIELDKEEINARDAIRQANLAILKGKEQGASQEELGYLRQGLDIQQQKLDAIARSRAVQEQLNASQQQELATNREITLEKRKQQDLEQSRNTLFPGQFDYGGAGGSSGGSSGNRTGITLVGNDIAKFDQARSLVGRSVSSQLNALSTGGGNQFVQFLASPVARQLSQLASSGFGGRLQADNLARQIDSGRLSGEDVNRRLDELIGAVNRSAGRPNLTITNAADLSLAGKIYNDISRDNARSMGL